MENPLKKLKNAIDGKLQKRAEKVLAKKKASDELWLAIHEYGLVKQGKSNLSASKRKAVVKFIDDAIESGAIKNIL